MAELFEALEGRYSPDRGWVRDYWNVSDITKCWTVIRTTSSSWRTTGFLFLFFQSLILLTFSLYRDVWYWDPVLLFIPTLPGPTQLSHLFTHVQLHHVTHHLGSSCFRKHNLQPIWWSVDVLYKPKYKAVSISNSTLMFNHNLHNNKFKACEVITTLEKIETIGENMKCFFFSYSRSFAWVKRIFFIF